MGWTFHDAYCGIGNARAGFELAGGVCTGAFDRCKRARQVYYQRFGDHAQGSLETIEVGHLGEAEVLYSAPPCESKRHCTGERERKQLWKQLLLVDQFKYKICIFELLQHVKQLEQGLVFRDFVGAMQKRGYIMHWKSMFTPDFGSAAARRRIVVVGLRADVHSRVGDYRYPDGTSIHHPLRSVLEPEFFRRGVRVRGSNLTLFPEPKQRTQSCLRQLGYLEGDGRGREVYSIQGLASAQLARGAGPGWTSGLYMINGAVSRLTVREVARLMQIEDNVTLDDNDSVSMRLLGGTTPVGMVHAFGTTIEELLASLKSPGEHRNWSAARLQQEAISSRPRTLTQQDQAGGVARHEAKMVAWQAAATARALAERAHNAVAMSGFWACGEDEQLVVRRGVKELCRRRWFQLQRRKGRAELAKLVAGGCSPTTARHARQTIDKALWLEEQRQGQEDGPINLLWWNWSGPIPEELRVGYRLPFRTAPASTFPDNYDTANVEKVWDEIARMNERGYLEGPVHKHDVHMTHPLSAVAKKGSEKVRVIIDMTASLLNECLVAQRFILPTVEDVATKCYRGAWMMTADLVDGFYGVEVCEEDRKYLGLRHPRTGKYYRYSRLAMGNRASPAAFSRLVAWAMREAAQYPEFKAVRVVVNDTDPHMPRVYGVGADGLPCATSDWFVDDGCIVAPTREKCLAAYNRLVWILECRLGWRICSRKTCGPAQRLLFCGLELDTVGADVGGPCTRLSDERRATCLALLSTFMAANAYRRRASRREMASLVGALSFAANAIPAGRCFLVRLYRAIHEMDEELRGDPRAYDRSVRLTTSAFLDLRWWEDCLRSAQCVRPWRSGTFALHRCWSDASNYGFAECLATEETDELPRMAFTHGVWPEAIAGFSSNWHELATVLHSIRSRAEELRDSNVHFCTDNTTTVKCVNSGVVHSVQLMKLSRELKLVQAQYNIGIEALHLSGKMMQLQGTDGASRSAPWLGVYSGTGGSHDQFSPMDWPRFPLRGCSLGMVNALRTSGTVDASDPRVWGGGYDAAGKDTFCHLRPCHGAQAMAVLFEGQLRDCAGTSFTVVLPVVGLKAWSRYLKHFRHKEVVDVQVEGLGVVKHWVLRYEKGDGILPRGRQAQDRHGGWDADLRSDDVCDGLQA
jgi:site-specific DNA-cytosine methylase